MNKSYCIAVIAVMLLILSACESGGNLKMINRTSFPVYTSVDSDSVVTIEAGEDHVFKIDTDTQTFLTGEVKRNVPVWLVGHTFSLQDRETNEFVDETVVTIKAGKTLNVYLDPNRASIKIVNNSEHIVTLAEIWEIKPTSQTRVGVMEDIMPGESQWKRVNHVTPQNTFSYRLIVYLDGEDGYLEFGDYDTILAKDEQWLVNVYPFTE
nr:hypothetical protein [Candidatus Cloacimonadota bacterium]